MDVALTDVLTCPRCGPEHRLVLLADRVEQRRVLDGWLGCANCREWYRVRDGFGDLRWPPGDVLPDAVAGPAADSSEQAIRAAALMGVTEGPGFLLVHGPAARLGQAIAAIVPQIEVVGVDAELAGWPEQAGVSRLVAGAALPFATQSMRGLTTSGTVTGAQIAEAARVLATSARCVVLGAPAAAAHDMAAAGLEILAQDADSIVAVRT